MGKRRLEGGCHATAALNKTMPLIHPAVAADSLWTLFCAMDTGDRESHPSSQPRVRPGMLAK